LISERACDRPHTGAWRQPRGAGGCGGVNIRLITTHESGIVSVAALKGKTVGTVSMASPDKNFISILAIKQGIDPIKDIEWRAYPSDLLGVALQKGEIQAFSGPDPIVSIIRDRDHLVEVTNNLTGEFAHRACCVLGIRGNLVRDELPVAAAITAAMMDAQEWVAENPDAAAAIFAGFTKVATAEQLSVLRQEVPREGLAAASDCDAVRRGSGEASPAGVCRLRLWRDRRQLAIALSVDP
jgi:NitT/TauT family transport system substrate-binding protein